MPCLQQKQFVSTCKSRTKYLCTFCPPNALFLTMTIGDGDSNSHDIVVAREASPLCVMSGPDAANCLELSAFIIRVSMNFPRSLLIHLAAFVISMAGLEIIMVLSWADFPACWICFTKSPFTFVINLVTHPFNSPFTLNVPSVTVVASARANVAPLSAVACFLYCQSIRFMNSFSNWCSHYLLSWK